MPSDAILIFFIKKKTMQNIPMDWQIPKLKMQNVSKSLNDEDEVKFRHLNCVV